MKRAAFLSCHLSGSGHLARTLILARAVAALGIETLVISGGRRLEHLPADGVGLAQLPPVSVADFDYATLRDDQGRVADAPYMARRASMLAGLLRDFRPDALVTELFPFGRRILAPEFEAALRLVDAPAYASVRDLPEPPRKPARYAETEARLRRWYRCALIHGDPAFAPLSLSWAQADAIADLVRQTGYVAQPLPPPEGDPHEVLVAEGGGALGRRLLETAVEAARLGTRPWRLRVGGADAETAAAALRARARGAPATVEPAAPDYRARLGAAAVSVSLLGYNTAVDLLQTGARAVIAPLSQAGEREQGLRARAFAALPQCRVVDPATITARRLAEAVTQALEAPRAPAATGVRLDGAETGAAIIAGG